MPVAVADFNKDGKLDIAALYYHKLTPEFFRRDVWRRERLGGPLALIDVPPHRQTSPA